MFAHITETNDTQKLTKERKSLEMTASEIRSLLLKPEYKAKYPVKINWTPDESKRVDFYENINSFGADVSDAFEDMCDELGRIPTQDEFVERTVELTREWLIREKLKRNPNAMNLVFDDVLVQAIKNRQGRGYLSIVSEMYTVALIKEMYPEAKVYTHDMLDLIMGVDIVMEYKGKRFYIHVYKNSYWGRTSFKNKEGRGGMYGEGGVFIKFNRDFTGDISLMYDPMDTDTTIYLNGVPLLTEDYIRFTVKRGLSNDAIGERLSTANSKLHRLNSWLLTHFGTFVDFGR